MISVTLRFDYPEFDGIDNDDENAINDLISEMAPDEILANAQDAGKVVNVDVEVY